MLKIGQDVQRGMFSFVSDETGGFFEVCYKFVLNDPDRLRYSLEMSIKGDFTDFEYKCLDKEITNMIPIKIEYITDELREDLIYYQDNKQNLNYNICWSYGETM